MAKRAILPCVLGALCLSGCEFDDLFSDDGPPPAPAVVYVGQPMVAPMYYDPYYNRPKYYVAAPPEVYRESTTKKTKGNKVYKTTTVKNQYGQTVYKNTTSKTKKKKK